MLERNGILPNLPSPHILHIFFLPGLLWCCLILIPYYHFDHSSNSACARPLFLRAIFWTTLNVMASYEVPTTCLRNFKLCLLLSMLIFFLMFLCAVPLDEPYTWMAHQAFDSAYFFSVYHSSTAVLAVNDWYSALCTGPGIPDSAQAPGLEASLFPLGWSHSLHTGFLSSQPLLKGSRTLWFSYSPHSPNLLFLHDFNIHK